MLKADSEIIVDDEIILRRFTHEIDSMKYEMILANHDHLLPWLPWADMYHKFEDMLNFTEDQIRAFDASEQFGYDIYYCGELAGAIDIHDVAEDDHHCDLGYWLDQNFTGKGIMTRSVAKLTDYCFNKLNMHRVAIKAAPENNASVAVAERLNFAKEARHREDQLLSNRYYDTIVYAKINETN